MVVANTGGLVDSQERICSRAGQISQERFAGKVGEHAEEVTEDTGIKVKLISNIKNCFT